MSTSEGLDHRRLHDEENADLSALLHDLEPAEWEQPSLCDGWRVRDVVGHILDGNELKLWTLPFRLARFGSVFGARRRTKGLRFEATDVDWSWGDGLAVQGPGEALLMAMLGRRAALDDLGGSGLDAFGAR